MFHASLIGSPRSRLFSNIWSSTALTTGGKLFLDSLVLPTYLPHFYSGVDLTISTTFHHKLEQLTEIRIYHQNQNLSSEFIRTIYITWCPTQLQISSPIAHQPTFHSARFTCEYARSFNHFPIKLANLIARQLITGTVIPFHIHNVVVQLHENGELRSAELSDIV